MKGGTSWIGLFVACSIGICSGAAAAPPEAPPPGYKIEEKYTRTSPEGAITVEQYLDARGKSMDGRPDMDEPQTP
ncbi:hypothetical protein [Bradyrhizobium erythrophlei]|jgi:hypothetical protein|uniref:Uncharacterized protein n=1 Tax=Bradyrhizobium erythrophlei TaxID=1437360 RepID=A0A1M5QFS8_9BRAD|nr:hypothetical protein [Bradyrhizobium erythrophlei]SHH12609.1 hypothetical protein SAMN05443248_3776 [Bradyrhizobium erythrophlei]